MIRLMARMFFVAPRMVLAGFLALTFPGVMWGVEKWEARRLERVRDEQRKRGFPTGVADLQSKATRLGEDHPFVAAWRMTYGYSPAEPVWSEGTMKDRWGILEKWEEAKKREFELVESVWKTDPELEIHQAVIDHSVIEGGGGGVQFSFNYRNLVGDHTRSAGIKLHAGEMGTSLDRILAALWICRYTGLEIDGVSAVQAMGYRIEVCKKLNLLATQWKQATPEERGKIKELIDALLETDSIMRSFAVKMAVTYDFQRAPSQVAKFTGPGIGSFILNSLVSNEDLEAWKREFRWLGPYLAMESRKLQEKMLHYQKAYSDLETEYDDDILGDYWLWRGQYEANDQHDLEYLLPQMRLNFFRMTAIHLACQLYRLDHGNFPTNLSDLTPDYLKEIPKCIIVIPWYYTAGGKPTLGYGHRGYETTQGPMWVRFEDEQGKTNLKIEQSDLFWKEYFGKQ